MSDAGKYPLPAAVMRGPEPVIFLPVVLESPQPNAFDASDMAQIALIADQIAAALQAITERTNAAPRGKEQD